MVEPLCKIAVIIANLTHDWRECNCQLITRKRKQSSLSKSACTSVTADNLTSLKVIWLLGRW